MSSLAIDANREQALLADLKHLERLGAAANPSAEIVRPNAEALRRLLAGGELQAVAAARGIDVAFHVPDSLPLVRDARNGHILMFNLAGLRIAGLPMSATWLARAGWAAADFNKGKQVALKPDAFLRQAVLFCDGELVSRQDVLTYMLEPHALPPKTRRAIGQLRRRMQIYIQNGVAMVMFHPPGEEQHAPAFRYEQAYIDVVYLEFIAAIQYLLGSPEVQALRAAIEDGGQPALH
jgi:hypothetical protein